MHNAFFTLLTLYYRYLLLRELGGVSVHTDIEAGGNLEAIIDCENDPKTFIAVTEQVISEGFCSPLSMILFYFLKKIIIQVCHSFLMCICIFTPRPYLALRYHLF